MKLAIRAVLKALSCSKFPLQRNYSNRYMQMAYLQLHCDIPLQYICEYLTDIILGYRKRALANFVLCCLRHILVQWPHVLGMGFFWNYWSVCAFQQLPRQQKLCLRNCRQHCYDNIFDFVRILMQCHVSSWYKTPPNSTKPHCLHTLTVSQEHWSIPT